MKAKLVVRQRQDIEDDLFAEYVVWKVPAAVAGSAHQFKYRFALVAYGECVLRFDNEAGKGDHIHIGDVEHGYEFESLEKLLADFRQAVETWRAE